MKDDGHVDNRKDKGGSSPANKALLSSALVSDKKPVVLSKFWHLNTECTPSQGIPSQAVNTTVRLQTARHPNASSIFHVLSVCLSGQVYK